MSENDELDDVRIRRLAAARRATYRSRSYCIIAVIALAVVAIQLVWMATASIRSAGLTRLAGGYLISACLSVYGVIYFARRARQLHREAAASLLPDPSAPPDLTTLSDGSARWKNLEDVR